MLSSTLSCLFQHPPQIYESFITLFEYNAMDTSEDSSHSVGLQCSSYSKRNHSVTVLDEGVLTVENSPHLH